MIPQGWLLMETAVAQALLSRTYMIGRPSRIEALLALATGGALSVFGSPSTRWSDIFGLLSIWVAYFSGGAALRFLCERTLRPAIAT